jgi:hypothetical protein
MLSSTKKSRLSKEIFTKVPLSETVLRYYNHAHIAAKMMDQFRTKSRKLFNDNLENWSKLMEPINKKVIKSITDICEFKQFVKSKYISFWDWVFHIDIQKNQWLNLLRSIILILKTLSDFDKTHIKLNLIFMKTHNVDEEVKDYIEKICELFDLKLLHINKEKTTNEEKDIYVIPKNNNLHISSLFFEKSNSLITNYFEKIKSDKNWEMTNWVTKTIIEFTTIQKVALKNSSCICLSDLKTVKKLKLIVDEELKNKNLITLTKEFIQNYMPSLEELIILVRETDTYDFKSLLSKKFSSWKLKIQLHYIDSIHFALIIKSLHSLQDKDICINLILDRIISKMFKNIQKPIDEKFKLSIHLIFKNKKSEWITDNFSRISF